jgi:hypothetical protein
MIAAVNTFTELLLSIHYDPCNESLDEPKIDHMGMTTAEAIPVAAEELGIKNVVNGESPPRWTFPPRKNEESCLGLKKNKLLLPSIPFCFD